MIKQGKTWLATWSTRDLHPQLPAGTHFTVKRTLPDRAALLDSAGTALFTPTPVVVIGIHPSKVTNLTVLAATLAAVLKISAADIVADVKAATAEQFVPVITLRRTSYDQVRAKVHDLPGTEFQEDTESLTPSATFAQPLLGRTGCFLPQVARETGWIREQLLSRLCTEKMGLQPEAWKHPGAVLEIFSILVVGPEPFE
jgi:hypothetical protein